MARHPGATSRAVTYGLAAALALSGPRLASAESLPSKSVQILVRAIAFLQPAPTGAAVVAIAYDPAVPASRLDADAIAANFGDGLKAGTASLKAQPVEISQLASGHFVAIIATAGVNIEQVFKSSQALRIPCITADALAVQSGRCVMSVQSDPKVDIQISASAASQSGVAFRSAFMFMAHVN